MHISDEGFIDYGIPVQGMQQPPPGMQGYPQQPMVDDYPDYPPETIRPIHGGAVYPGQDAGFLKWLFDFRKEAVQPLRHVWRGHEFNFEDNRWIIPNPRSPIMNETGITWGISLIESYMNPAFIVTDFDTITYNFRMREAVKVIWNNLCLRYIDFDLKKPDIPRVAEEIESKISAILRGALDNGYRDYFSTQNQYVETKNISPMPQAQKPGFFTRTASFLRHVGGEQ